jgi:hypothetical protein
MEAFQKVLAVIGAVVGVVTALLTLYAKYLNVRKAARDLNGGGAAGRAAAPVLMRPPRALPLS